MKTDAVQPVRQLVLAGIFAVATSASLFATGPNTFEIDKLVSDVPGSAAFTDLNLVNPWGIAASPTGPFWVADNGSGKASIFDGAGTPNALTVNITPGPGNNVPAPTGTVFNGGSGFNLNLTDPARFIFSAEDGSISGWNSANPNQTIVQVATPGAVYKGLAIGNNGSGDFLYAADFAGGKIDVFDSGFSPATLTGTFLDPTLPAGYAPFNVQNLNGKLYVTYAKADSSTHDDIPGSGHGVVSVFDLNGNLVSRLVTGGKLDSPWGLALAPADFGPFGGDLLVGNAGDGKINVYDPVTGTFAGALQDMNGDPLVIERLWGLQFGNGVQAGDSSDLYFAAGISGGASPESHGLFGKIFAAESASTGVPDGGASTAGLLGMALISFGLCSVRQTKAK